MKKLNLNPQTKTKLMYEEKMKTEPLTEEEIKHYRFVLFTYNRLEKQWRTIKVMIIYLSSAGVELFFSTYQYILSLFIFACTLIYIICKSYQIKHKLIKPRKNEWYQYVAFCGISTSAIFHSGNINNVVIFYTYQVIQFSYSIYYGNKAYQYGKKDNEKNKFKSTNKN